MTLSNVRRGVAQMGTLGYWIGLRHARQGHMTAALGAIDGFAFELALKLCMPLTANMDLLNEIKALRQAFVEEAKRINGGESTEEVARDSRYLRARAS